MTPDPDQALHRILEVIDNSGRNPSTHWGIHARHAAEWPTLWNAISDARKALDVPAVGLRRWKQEAIVVMDQWQEIWELLGKPGKAGESVAVATLAEVKAIKAERDRLRQRVTHVVRTATGKIEDLEAVDSSDSEILAPYGRGKLEVFKDVLEGLAGECGCYGHGKLRAYGQCTKAEFEAMTFEAMYSARHHPSEDLVEYDGIERCSCMEPES